MGHDLLHDIARWVMQLGWLLVPGVLVASLFVAYGVTRGQTPRYRGPTSPPWTGEPKPPSWQIESLPPAPPATLPLPRKSRAQSSGSRRIMAVVGIILLFVGVCMPASPLVSSALFPTMGGKFIYALCAAFASLQVLRSNYAGLIVSGGISAALLGVTAVVSAFTQSVHLKGSLHYDPSFFALGWGWLVMLAGSLLTLAAGWFDPNPPADDTPTPS